MCACVSLKVKKGEIKGEKKEKPQLFKSFEARRTSPGDLSKWPTDASENDGKTERGKR